MGTVLVAAVLFGTLGYIVYTMIRNKKKGKTGCSYGCAGCDGHCPHQ